MRQTVIIATTALVTAIVAIWGTTIIIAHSPKSTSAASSSINVMEMMKNAKNLPEEKFDAH